MSKETSINNIQQPLSKEEDDIVTSILSEINETSNIQTGESSNIQTQLNQQNQPIQQNQQVHNQSLEYNQQNQPAQNQQLEYNQQNLSHPNQQIMKEQIMKEQMIKEQMIKNMPDSKNNTSKSTGIFQSIKNIDIKEPFIIAFIAFILFLPQTNNMLLSTGISAFIGEDGSISIIGTAFKCLTIGILYFTFKTFIQNKS